MEEQAKKWEDLTEREQNKRIKKFNAWGITDLNKIKGFFEDTNDYDEQEQEEVVEEKEQVQEDETLIPAKPKQEDKVVKENQTEGEKKLNAKVEVLENTSNPFEDRIVALENELKAYKEMQEVQSQKINKAYEILEAQGKDYNPYQSAFGGETRNPNQAEETNDLGKRLFEK